MKTDPKRCGKCGLVAGHNATTCGRPAPVKKGRSKTHCKRGHEFTPENTRIRPDGRECWTCKRMARSKADPVRMVWRQMIHRCHNPKSSNYANYGARGIAVCDEWRASFNAFMSDMGLRPSAAHSIDRIDNDGNYEPGNCRWATIAEQSRKKRTTKLSEEAAESMRRLRDACVSYEEIGRRFGVSGVQARNVCLRRQWA